MTLYSDHMTQTASYAAPDGQNGFGDPQFLAAVDVACRWQDKADLFRDSQGREVVSSAVVYVASEVEVGGTLDIGDGPREIRNIGKSPSLDGAETLVKVWL